MVEEGVLVMAFLFLELILPTTALVDVLVRIVFVQNGVWTDKKQLVLRLRLGE